jgi:hypothetical protein
LSFAQTPSFFLFFLVSSEIILIHVDQLED